MHAAEEAVEQDATGEREQQGAERGAKSQQGRSQDASDEVRFEAQAL